MKHLLQNVTNGGGGEDCALPSGEQGSGRAGHCPWQDHGAGQHSWHVSGLCWLERPEHELTASAFY